MASGEAVSQREGLALDLELGGQVAFVTGASKGIGRAVAEQLAREGADVVITARTAEPLETAAKQITAATGGTIVPMAGDMSEAADDQWMSSLNLKFMGYVRSVRAVIPHMRARGEGVIVLVVGNDGLKPSYWEMTAGVANAADINFASSVAEQYGRYGVRINTVNPGPVNTGRWDTLEKAFARDKGVTQDQAHELATRSIPFGRICEPGEVAALVTFLASPRASFINGAHIPIDGAQRKAIMDQ